MTDHVVVEIADGILSLRMNRPDKKNAILLAMYGAIADALEDADRNPAVRVITLTGTGDSFTSGNDLKDFMQRPPEGDSPALRFLNAISTVGKPLIGIVNGLAVGVGVTMLLHCDLVYAAENAAFQLPFVNLGLVPEAASTLLLPRLMGHQRAAELLLLGDSFSARVAHEIGIVNAVFPAADLSSQARRRAMALAAKPPASVRIIKSLLKSKTGNVAERMQEELAHFTRQLASPEWFEAMEAFTQRRKPDFSRFS